MSSHITEIDGRLGPDPEFYEAAEPSNIKLNVIESVTPESFADYSAAKEGFKLEILSRSHGNPDGTFCIAFLANRGESRQTAVTLARLDTQRLNDSSLPDTPCARHVIVPTVESFSYYLNHNFDRELHSMISVGISKHGEWYTPNAYLGSKDELLGAVTMPTGKHTKDFFSRLTKLFDPEAYSQTERIREMINDIFDTLYFVE